MEKEFTAKTVTKAVEEGLAELNKKHEEVDIRVISEGGLFKKAKIVISYEEEENKNETKTEVVSQNLISNVEVEKVEEVKKEPVKATKKAEVKVENDKQQPKAKEQQSDEPKENKASKRERTNSIAAKTFLEGLLKIMNINGEVTVEETEEFTKILISSDKDGLLIGYRGEGLNGLQYVVNNIEQRVNKDAKRILINIANYRDKRDESLKELANRIGKKVLKSRRKYEFEPMTAYERRVIHTALQEMDGITTYSEGAEPKRRLVVDIDRKKQ